VDITKTHTKETMYVEETASTSKGKEIVCANEKGDDNMVWEEQVC